MLTTPITHPELLAALARCGHGTKILLADGNYPHLTGVPAGTTRIALNVTPASSPSTRSSRPWPRPSRSSPASSCSPPRPAPPPP